MLAGRFFSVLSIDILFKASGFILLPLYLWLMTQSEYGLYSYILSIIQTFSLVLNLGLYVPQSKLYHTYTSERDRGELLFTLITMLCFFLAILGILFSFSELDDWIIKTLFDHTGDYGKYKFLIGLALVVSIFSFMLINFFYTSEKIRQVRTYNIYRIIGVNGFSLLALYFFHEDKVGIRLGFTYGIELLLICLCSISFFKELVPVFNKKMMQKSLNMGLPIMISALFGIVVNFSDKFLLQKYGSLVDLSNYFLAFSFASIIPLIFASLQNVWLPIFMKEKDVYKNFEKTKRIISRLLIIFFFISIGIWLLYNILFSMQIIPNKYYDVIWILPLLLITQIFAAIAPLFSNYLIYFEKTNLVLLSGLIVSILSISLGLWLIPLLGVLGATITTLIVNLAYMIIYYFFLLFLKRRYAGINNTTTL